jgi:hypothetical protein
MSRRFRFDIVIALLVVTIDNKAVGYQRGADGSNAWQFVELECGRARASQRAVVRRARETQAQEPVDADLGDHGIARD